MPTNLPITDLENLGQIITQHIDPRMSLVIIALWLLGIFLKNTPSVPDWAIIWILAAVSIGLAVLVLGPSVDAVIQGILTAASAIFGHQIIKQTGQKRNK